MFVWSSLVQIKGVGRYARFAWKIGEGRETVQNWRVSIELTKEGSAIDIRSAWILCLDLGDYLVVQEADDLPSSKDESHPRDCWWGLGVQY